MVLETHIKLCITAGFSGKKFFFCPQIGKIDQKWTNLLQNLIINFY